MLGNLGLAGRDILVVSGVQSCKSCLVRLADLLELLYVAPSCREIDLCHLQGRPIKHRK